MQWTSVGTCELCWVKSLSVAPAFSKRTFVVNITVNARVLTRIISRLHLNVFQS